MSEHERVKFISAYICVMYSASQRNVKPEVKVIVLEILFEIDRLWLICAYLYVEKVIPSFLIIIIITVPMAAPISLLALICSSQTKRHIRKHKTKVEMMLIRKKN